MLTITGTSRVAKASNLVKHAEEKQTQTIPLRPRGTNFTTFSQHDRENSQSTESGTSRSVLQWELLKTYREL